MQVSELPATRSSASTCSMICGHVCSNALPCSCRCLKAEGRKTEVAGAPSPQRRSRCQAHGISQCRLGPPGHPTPRPHGEPHNLKTVCSMRHPWQHAACFLPSISFTRWYPSRSCWSCSAVWRWALWLALLGCCITRAVVIAWEH